MYSLSIKGLLQNEFQMRSGIMSPIIVGLAGMKVIQIIGVGVIASKIKHKKEVLTSWSVTQFLEESRLER